MAYRYFMSVGAQGDDAQHASHQLRMPELPERWRTPGYVLYASDQTPVLPLGDAGLIIGHVFNRHGARLTHASQLACFARADGLRRHIVEYYWGAYLLVLAEDTGSKGVSILRDPEGGMPCLHALQHDTGFVTSDVELAVHIGNYQKQVDWRSIAHRLIYPDIKTARTGLCGLEELLPGTWIAASRAQQAPGVAWCPWDFASDATHDVAPPVATAAIRTSVEMVVKTWAATDRNVLLELSGGLDSSVVGACLKQSQANITCCTLVTPVPGADERRYASQIAALLGVPLHADVLDLQPNKHDFRLPYEIATPRVGMLQNATDTRMRQMLQQHGATSFFSGGGGDTVFCYLTTAAPAVDALRGKGLRTAWQSVGDLAELHQCTLWRAAWLTLRKQLRQPKSPYQATHDFIHPRHTACRPQHHPWLSAPANALPGDRERIHALATTQVYRDSAPRGWHAHLRLPLLSQPVMEAALRIPSWMWIRGGQNRAVARQAFADLLPAEVLARRSKGAFTGYVGALYAKHQHQLQAYLLDGQLHAHGLLDRQALQRFFAHPLAPRDRRLGRVLDLCAVENWVRHQS
ncbi:asparagine synthase C-terminal domain-containing protein [Xanthomonas arboricola]|uniref:asparagine synthase (glutamine-hydrolyzing) n=1 Tax=Xanthomonas arboricola TaxID=56448 RepID=A0AAU9HQC8_9XANT|nr:asparagine synthase C-terminal domain-containing protein [Xanthomonas arboricola]CAE6709632.1 hypothetical protein XA1314C_06430 [Xanthomonas arboricola]CAE6709649.1 hypothetical protein XA1314C_06430 [Xanthomonas arboricola]